MLKVLRLIAKITLPILILAVGVFSAIYLIETRPTAKKKPSVAAATLVEVMEAVPTDQQVYVSASGNVKPAQSIVLQPQVSGEVIEVSDKFVPGGLFKKGEIMLKIEPRDYQYAVDQKKGEVAQAELSLKEEKGRQSVAEREWDLLGKESQTTELGRTLALRQPHIQAQKAALQAAKSSLEQSQLDLERTVIRAPFNALIREEQVDIGQQVSPQSQLATLVGTDQYWVEALVQGSDLPWTFIPEVNAKEGSKAEVIFEGESGFEIRREGEVVQLLGDLKTGGRMARLLVAIDDPLRRQSEENQRGFPLFLNSFVRLEIEGPVLENVFVLPEKLIQEHNRIWIMNQEEQLEIRQVEILKRIPNGVILRDGLQEGEQIVTSRISTPIPGMALRTSQKEESDTIPSVTQKTNTPNISSPTAEREE